MFVQIGDIDEKIAELERDLRERAREDEQTVRLMSVPGIGPLCAMAIQAFAPPLESGRRPETRRSSLHELPGGARSQRVARACGLALDNMDTLLAVNSEDLLAWYQIVRTTPDIVKS